MAKKYNRTTGRIIRICTLAILCAMQIVFARFLAIPIGTSLRFSLSFIPVVIAARHYGIVGGMLVYGLGDLIGAIALPTTGAYLPGFTVTAVISGLIFGVFLGKECSPFWQKLFFFDKKQNRFQKRKLDSLVQGSCCHNTRSIFQTFET